MQSNNFIPLLPLSEHARDRPLQPSTVENLPPESQQHQSETLPSPTSGPAPQAHSSVGEDDNDDDDDGSIFHHAPSPFAGLSLHHADSPLSFHARLRADHGLSESGRYNGGSSPTLIYKTGRWAIAPASIVRSHTTKPIRRAEYNGR